MMNVSVERQAISEVLLIRSPRFEDERGYFSESFRASWLEDAGMPRPFVQENHSNSVHRGVVRGLHFQVGEFAQDKLVRCLSGRILDVAVDIRSGSPTFGQSVSVELSGDACEQLFVPIGFAHGFVTLEKNSQVSYKTSTYYSPLHEQGIRWDDPDIGIDWRTDGVDVTLSAKDKDLPSLSETPQHFLYQGEGYDCSTNHHP